MHLTLGCERGGAADETQDFNASKSDGALKVQIRKASRMIIIFVHTASTWYDGKVTNKNVNSNPIVKNSVLFLK